MMPQLISPNVSVSGEQQVVQGSVADWTITCVDSSDQAMVFASGDTVTSYVYQGESQVNLFSPTTIWSPPTGYLTATVQISPTSLQTATLDPNGYYSLQIWWTSADSTRTACIGRQSVRVLPGPSTGTQTITTYCTLRDMLRYANWITTVQDTNTDQEGFYPERLLARQWMDWTIANCYRGSYVGLYSGHSVTAFAWVYSGWRRSLGPSPSLLDYLAADLLILDPYIVEACAYKAISIIGTRQIGQNDRMCHLGYLFEAKATKALSGITACINTQPNSGLPHGALFVNLNSTNTLMT
jgi:hypothetical protein